MSRIGRARAFILVIAIAAGCCAVPASAGAASPAFQIGSYPVLAGQLEIPSIEVDPSGTAYVAWPDLSANKIDFCVIPDGAQACAQSGQLTPVLEPGANPKLELSAGTLNPFGHVAEVLIDNGMVSIIAGTVGPSDEGNPTSGGWLPEVEMWQAPDGSANFSLVNDGSSVAYPEPRESYTAEGHTYAELSYFEDGVEVPGGGELGVDTFTPAGPPTFEAFAQQNPPACSELSHPLCPFATLEPEGNPDQVSNYGFLINRQIVSETGANPGILGVDLTEPYGSGSFACTPTGATAPQPTDSYFYGSGLQTPTNDYNISPGQPDSAWKVGASPIPDECPARPAAIAGGPSGFGLFEATGYSSADSILRYRSFDTTTDSFDEPAVTVDAAASAATLGLSQDGAGDIYATGLIQDSPPGSPGGSASSGAPLALFYSSDGGKTWRGPGSLESTIQPGFSRSESAVGADGKGWMVITANGTLYALEFNAADAKNAFSPRLGVKTVAQTTVTATVSCNTVPCNVSTELLPVASASSKVTTHTILGSGRAQITRHGAHRISIKLTRAGSAELRAHHGKLSASLSETTALGPYSVKRVVRVKLKLPRRSRR